MELRPAKPPVWLALLFLAVFAALAIGLGLGSSSWLTYHEAFVAQGAREILASGNWSHPAIGGLPWLEKPPLPFWLVAVSGWCAGEVTPLAARLPSGFAALGLIFGVSLLAMHRYGWLVGTLSGAIQATTAWTVLRGRLAEADILLAGLVTWSLLAFDRMRTIRTSDDDLEGDVQAARPTSIWRWVFFGLLGVMSLVKGIGFGAVLVLSVVLLVLIWDRDARLAFRLCSPPGWLLVVVLTFSWPLAMVWQHGVEAAGLWALHITARLGPATGHGVFASETWREYALNILGQGLPWTPLALLGFCHSVRRRLPGSAPSLALQACERLFPTTSLKRKRRGSLNRLTQGQGAGTEVGRSLSPHSLGDRLLWAWSLAPLLLVSLASGRNAHYAIHAMIPWSVWSAKALTRLADRLRSRGAPRPRLIRLAIGTFAGLAMAYGLGFWFVGSRFNRREAERAFYRAINSRVSREEPLALLYDDWDREPYPTPFGPIPHDLAIRLYSVGRPLCWHFDVESLVNHERQRDRREGMSASRSDQTIAVIARRRDLAALRSVGRVEVLCEAEPSRWDRNYLLARVWVEERIPLQAHAGTRPLR
jgi:4-amino-4-deoxy-L-arabinose transferase-like glycosyltransferase